MTFTQTVDIPADRRVRFDFKVPLEIPEGQTKVVIQFPVWTKSQPSETTVAGEKSKMLIPRDSTGKLLLTEEIIAEMEKNSPTLHKIAGILHTDMTVDEIRMARLAKHL